MLTPSCSIVIFSLLLAGNHIVCVVDCKVELYAFRAFADFLLQQHLKHAIVAYNGESLKSLQQQRLEYIHQDDTLRALFNITAIRFYDVQQTTRKSGPFTNFKNLFFSCTPRVGIYLTRLEDTLLQEHVLGTHDIDNFKGLMPRVQSVGKEIFSRFNNCQAWFIMSEEQSVAAALRNLRQIMTPLPLNISSDITLGVHVDKNNTILLFDIYKIHPNSLEIEEKGYWSPIRGVQLKTQFLQSYIWRRRNFKGLQLRGGTVMREKPANFDDLEYLNSLNFKNLDTMQRKTFQLLSMLQSMFNVSFHVSITNTLGQLLPNGSWDGVMEMLLAGEVELALCPMRFDSKRVSLIQYTPGVHVEHISFIFRYPRHDTIRNIFFAPFKENVWYAVLVVIVLTTLLLLLHMHYESRNGLNNYSHFQYRLDYAILSISEAFFMQGPDTDAYASTSTRLLIFFVCSFSLLLQQFYSAFIVGSLLSVSPRTITTMEALYNSSLEIGMENIPYNYDIIGASTIPLVNAMYKRKIDKDRKRHVLKIEEGAERIKKGGFAFHVSANRMYFLLKDILNENEFCDLQQISFVPPYHSGIAVVKLSPYRDYITSSILRWGATGLLQHNDQQWQIPQLDCSLSQNNEVYVDLQHFIPAILLLCTAMLFCVSILVLEIIYAKLEHRLKLAIFF